jgi:flagella basal body P-ring formation protein FlgA
MTTIFRHLMLIAAAIAAPASAQSFENLDMLEGRLVEALAAGIGEPGGPSGPIDRRLRLAPCPQPAQIDAPALGAVAIRCPALGWRIRVPLTPGAMAAAAAAPVRAEPIIRRGDQVEVVALTSTFSVSTVGTAEQDGAPGDRIRVRTDRRSAPFVGQVLADGRIALPGFN